MSASSYFSSRFPAMWVVLVESAPICTVFMGTWSGSDDWTLGAFAGALGCEVVGSSSECAASAARACSLSTAATTAVRSPYTVRTPAGEGIFKTKYP